MKLFGDELKKLSEALLDAYRNHNALKRMVKFKLEENLDAIAGRGILRDVVFDLIDWAEAEGKLELLIIGAYEENSGNPKLKAFYETLFQTRFITHPIITAKDVGPDINWLGSTIEEIQLQSFWQPQPDWYDVGFLKRAIAQAGSVCRLEIPTQNIKATGVLIAPRLVLTNYHVLKLHESDDIQANALNAILHFGCFTAEDGMETEGQSFSLDKEKPILHFSPTQKLDYVLLQLDSNILGAKEVKPAQWQTNNSLIAKQGINLLQHPSGDSMKLSISCDGIANVFLDKGLIQYVNKTVRGSSGSPCFDENWKLVALHHAERTKGLSSIREGILFSAIYPEIQSFL
ncbi:MAG: trypsin-like peptidase domain-containing protein [Richelia sp. RM2_1_2]|nr:trypsin-like peptidase domain-containing protein [Richelia sp. SM1_7_0]NJN07458.1 trypsin-like peptidase domain-containing protein [Richelia sp. RM1_1_1]NJO57416.1 trypsin-like peptidase domain-containing protein [Richelia sp. RM2_1_2]